MTARISLAAIGLILATLAGQQLAAADGAAGGAAYDRGVDATAL